MQTDCGHNFQMSYKAEKHSKCHNLIFRKKLHTQVKRIVFLSENILKKRFILILFDVSVKNHIRK